MGYPKLPCDGIDRASYNKLLDESSLEPLEDSINEAVLDNVDSHFRNNNLESMPLSSDMRLELRSRVRRQSGSGPKYERLGGEQSRQSFWDTLQRWFWAMLGRLQQRWQRALAWLKELVTTGVQALCSAVELMWQRLKNFCCSLMKCLALPLGV